MPASEDGPRRSDGGDDSGDGGAQHPSDGAQTCSAARGLLLYLLIEPGPGQVPVELPADATVAALRAAAHDAGAGSPALQVLSIGAHELTEPDDTPLSDTLVTSEAVVAVRTAARRGSVLSCCGDSTLVLLESGVVMQWQASCGPEASAPRPVLTPDVGTVTSVYDADEFSVAIVDGTVRVLRDDNEGETLWVSAARKIEEELLGQQIVACAVRSSADLHGCELVAVDSEGHLHFCGDANTHNFPAGLQGRVADVCFGGSCTAVLTREGDVYAFTHGTREWRQQPLGGRAAVHINAGGDHYTAVLDDGSVRCFGCRPGEKCFSGHCNVPSDLRNAVSCCCSFDGCAALRADGSICWWGRGMAGFASGPIAEAGPCAAVAVTGGRALAVTHAGRLVSDCLKERARVVAYVYRRGVSVEQVLAAERGTVDLHGHRVMTR